MSQTTFNEFDETSKTAAKMLVLRSAAVIAELLEDPEARSISDAVRVYEAANKRLGLYQNEKQENLPIIQWNISGGNVTIGVTAPPAATGPAAIEMVDEVVTVQATPEPSPVAFSLNLAGIETLSDSDL